MAETACASPLVASLPRWVIYPVLRALVYGEYLMQKAVIPFLGKDFNIFHPKPKVGPPVPAGEFNKRIGFSLRSVVRSRAMAEPPKNPAEAIQDLLSIGL